MGQATQATNATKPEPVKMGDAIKEPNKPELAPKHVTINDAGQAFRTVLVRLPEGMTHDDFRTAARWKLVQQSQVTALLKFDHLLILSFDESQFWRAIVSHSSKDEVHLVIEKAGSFREVGQAFYTDGTLEVFWNGGGYSFRRIADKVCLDTVSYQTEGQAIESLRKSYPVKAA